MNAGAAVKKYLVRFYKYLRTANWLRDKLTKHIYFGTGRFSLTSFVDWSASIVGLITQRHLADVPLSIGDLRYDVAVPSPSILRNSRLSVVGNATSQHH